MTPQELQKIVTDALAAIAPEVDVARLDPSRPLRRQVDLDSMDWLNFLVSLHQQLHVDIPESEYATLDSVDAIVHFLQARAA